MLELGVQTKNVVMDDDPFTGFQQIKNAGFTCCDFSLNAYLTNEDIKEQKVNRFFDKSIEELKEYFKMHKQAAKETGIRISQMHMPYPIYFPKANESVNAYLKNQVAPKSMELCHFLECNYMVIHGFKMVKYLGSEDAEWKLTEEFIEFLAPLAKKYEITLCIENIYETRGGHIVEGPCCDIEKAVERIDRINEKFQAEVLGFCLDTGHANLVGLCFEDTIRKLGNRLKVLHIHDNDGLTDLHQIPYTFTRSRENKPSTDWEGFISGLKAISFDRVLNFETAPALSVFPETLKEDTLSFIAKIGMDFKKRMV